MDKPHMYLREYSQEVERGTCIAINGAVVYSTGDQDIWLIGGIWPNLGHNWIPF